MSDDLIVKAGPFDLPGDAEKYGTLTWEQRLEIRNLSGDSAAVRDRKNTGGKRHLTLSGPVSGIALAKELAMKYIVESQLKNVPFEPSLSDEKR